MSASRPERREGGRAWCGEPGSTGLGWDGDALCEGPEEKASVVGVW